MRNVLFFLLIFPSLAFGAYEPPDPAYAPPASYYTGAMGTGTTLESNLNTIINTGLTRRTYGQLRDDLSVTDRDPSNSSNVLLIYNRASVAGAWDSGVTWNREHIWADTRLGPGNNDPDVNYKGPASDLFNLRPANPTINGNRGNLNFGTSTSTGTYGPAGSYWFPSDQDKGDVARAMFYMATAYSSLSLVNGNPAANQSQIGDLQALLKWNYTDGVDNFERHRNDIIYDTYQHNRNPYVDHPEYVWAAFGGSNNTSQVSVASPATNGTSSTTANLGTVIVGASFGTQTVTLSKTGTTPTTFDVTTGGNAILVAGGTNLIAGVGQTFDYNNQSRNVVVGLTSVSTPGSKTGTITIDNTDLTTAAAGQGSADGNDTINVTGTVLNHANGSFLATDTNSLTLSFGTLNVGTGAHQLPFSIRNLATTAGFTAPLDLLTVGSSGSTSVLTTNLAAFTNLAEAGMLAFNASLSTATAGNYSATYTLNLSDRATILGATTQQLILTLTGSVVPFMLGDFDGNNQRTAADIPAMLHALTDLNAYEATRGITASQLLAIGDCNGDGAVTNSDIQSLLNSFPNPVPEPATWILFISAASIVRFSRTFLTLAR
jgi:endonuclease I